MDIKLDKYICLFIIEDVQTICTFFSLVLTYIGCEFMEWVYQSLVNHFCNTNPPMYDPPRNFWYNMRISNINLLQVSHASSSNFR